MSTAKATTTPADGIHQRSGNLRISQITSAPPTAAITAPIPADFATSASQGPIDCVESPASTARSWRQIASGRPTTTSATDTPAAATAPLRIGGGRRASTASVDAGEGDARQAEHPLHVTEVGRSLQLGRAEVRCQLDGGRFDQAAPGPQEQCCRPGRHGRGQQGRPHSPSLTAHAPGQ